MFFVVARYKVKEEHQKKFLKESKNYYSNKFKTAKGFRDIKFLKNILDKEFIDVIIEWETKQNFFDFINKYQKEGVMKFSFPVEILDRFLYESLE